MRVLKKIHLALVATFWACAVLGTIVGTSTAAGAGIAALIGGDTGPVVGGISTLVILMFETILLCMFAEGAGDRWFKRFEDL